MRNEQQDCLGNDYITTTLINLRLFPQVFLGPDGEVEEYSVISIQQNAAISSDLILDQEEEHLFIMTHNMVDTTSALFYRGPVSSLSL